VFACNGCQNIPCKRVLVPLVRSPHTVKPTRRHYVPPLAFRVVRPYGRDKAREATMISEHATAADAFAEIDRLRTQMARMGAPAHKTELIVVDTADQIVPRPQ
jgi:hypothetical protein